MQEIDIGLIGLKGSFLFFRRGLKRSLKGSKGSFLPLWLKYVFAMYIFKCANINNANKIQEDLCVRCSLLPTTTTKSASVTVSLFPSSIKQTPANARLCHHLKAKDMSQGYTTFFMLNSAEHEISTAHRK